MCDCKKQYIYIGILSIIYILPVFLMDSFGMLLFCSVCAFLVLIENNVKIEVIRKQKCSKNDLGLIAVIMIAFFLSGLNIKFNNNYARYLPLLFYMLFGCWWLKNEDKKVFEKHSLFCLIPVSICNIKSYYFEEYLYTAYGIGTNFHEFLQCFCVAAIPEELFFRGFLYHALKVRMGITKARIISSLLFGVWHLKLLIRYVQNGEVNVLFNVIAIFFLGYVNTKLVDKYNIFIPIIFHALVNGALAYLVACIFF